MWDAEMNDNRIDHFGELMRSVEKKREIKESIANLSRPERFSFVSRRSTFNQPRIKQVLEDKEFLPVCLYDNDDKVNLEKISQHDDIMATDYDEMQMKMLAPTIFRTAETEGVMEIDDHLENSIEKEVLKEPIKRRKFLQLP